MGEDRYPWWHPQYKPIVRKAMKQVKAEYNKHLQKHSLSKTKAR